MRPTALVAGLALIIVPLQAKEADAIKVTRLSSLTTTSSGQPIVLPQKDAQIVVSIYEIAPGAVLPEHKHPYPRYGYVLAGILRVTNTEIDKTDTYHSGDFFAEGVGEVGPGLEPPLSRRQGPDPLLAAAPPA